MLFVALLMSCSAMAAEPYPAKPIRIVVPFPPGGLSDGLARYFAMGLVEQNGQQVIVDNRPGAGTTLAAEAVARSAPDGYTLFFQDITTHGINAGIYRKLPYDTLKDFTPIAMASASPLVLTVHPSIPASSVKELVAIAKSRPGDLNYGSSGSGAILHLAGELFKKLAGVDLVHVPYKGSPPAVTALLQGEVAIVFATTGSVIPHMQAGKVRALAVTTAQRSPLMANLPAIAETIPGYDVRLYQAILAPANMPRDVVVKLNAQLNRIMASAAAKQQWTRLGAEAVIVTPEELAQRFQDEVAKLSRLAAETGARVD